MRPGKLDEISDVLPEENKDHNNNLDQRHNNDHDQSISTPSNKEILYDQIINAYGYGTEIWKIIICTLNVYIVNSYFSTYFPNMVTAYTKKYSLTENQIAFIGLVFFMGKMIGCLSTGLMSKYFSRESIIRSFLFILLILNIFTGLIEGLTFLNIFRIISGFLCGVLEVLINNILCEYLPNYYRSFTLNASYSGFSFAQIICDVIMVYTMPNMEVEGIVPTHYIFSVFTFIAFILSFVILFDSPRNLIINGNETKAIEILCRIKDKRFFTEENKKRLISEIKEGVNLKNEENYFEIFTNRTYICFTLCLGLCCFGYNVLNDGGRLIINIIFKMINVENMESDDKNILINNIIINLVNPFSCLMFGILSEINLLGRRSTISIGFILISISLSLSIALPNHIVLYFTFFTFFCNIGNSLFTYAAEYYPTKIRDTSMGWINFITYLGSASSQYFLLISLKISWRAPVIVMLVISITCAIVILCTPFETLGRALDSENNNIEKIKDNKNYKELKDEEKANLINEEKHLE